MTDPVDACPDCDSTDIYRRKPSLWSASKRRSDAPYYCSTCGADFETPTTRTREAAGTLSGLPKRLHDAE